MVYIREGLPDVAFQYPAGRKKGLENKTPPASVGGENK